MVSTIKNLTPKVFGFYRSSDGEPHPTNCQNHGDNEARWQLLNTSLNGIKRVIGR